jgi:exopolysaccharide biosynthesis WecB/TagA/CpsF family protein
LEFVVINRGKRNVLGVLVDAVDYEEAVERIIAAARQRRPLAVSALAVHGVMTGVLDPIHRHRLNALDLVVPDGQPVRWALNRLYGAELADRVYGPALMLKTCQRAAEEQLPVFLFGGTQTLLDRLVERLETRFPALRIAGAQPSKFRRLRPDERDETVTRIDQSGAALVFVGLGCPRQEVWAYEFRATLGRPILAVGAAFNFHAGLLRQAPLRMQQWGLEWLYRLLAEPRRLWRRYLLLNPLYASLLCLQLCGLRHFDSARTQPPTEELLYG